MYFIKIGILKPIRLFIIGFLPNYEYIHQKELAFHSGHSQVNRLFFLLGFQVPFYHEYAIVTRCSSSHNPSQIIPFP